MKPKPGDGARCPQTLRTAARSPLLPLAGHVGWQGRLQKEHGLARSGSTAERVVKTRTPLDEIDAWENEGGAGSQVRR